jgi:hypothetical protein
VTSEAVRAGAHEHRDLPHPEVTPRAAQDDSPTTSPSRRVLGAKWVWRAGIAGGGAGSLLIFDVPLPHLLLPILGVVVAAEMLSEKAWDRVIELTYRLQGQPWPEQGRRFRG